MSRCVLDEEDEVGARIPSSLQELAKKHGLTLIRTARFEELMSTIRRTREQLDCELTRVLNVLSEAIDCDRKEVVDAALDALRDVSAEFAV